jgi:hypothetical protein
MPGPFLTIHKRLRRVVHVDGGCCAGGGGFSATGLGLL